MLQKDKFELDLEEIVYKIFLRANSKTQNIINNLKEKLIELHKKNMVKISHSVMELVCAKYLIEKGYEIIDIEHKLNELLVCDIYGLRGEGDLIVEIETGFIPPEGALKPSIYSIARIISKIARYSVFSNKFALGTPPYYILMIPELFFKPIRERSLKEALELKKICDIYYRNPPIEAEDIRKARLHTIYVIDVDNLKTIEIDPENYMDNYISRLKSYFPSI
ncbi:MAG: hypothetical protein QXP60_00815 [Nitrososphaerota archaeon]